MGRIPEFLFGLTVGGSGFSRPEGIRISILGRRSKFTGMQLTRWCQTGTILMMKGLSLEPRTRITARVSGKVRSTLEQAAELVGATVNQYVVQAAYQEAQRLLERETVIRLSQADARRILSLLDKPPETNKALKNAVKAFKGAVRA